METRPVGYFLFDIGNYSPVVGGFDCGSGRNCGVSVVFGGRYGWYVIRRTIRRCIRKLDFSYDSHRYFHGSIAHCRIYQAET